MKTKRNKFKSGLLGVAVFAFCLLPSHWVEAAQARALVWQKSNVTSQCKDPDGDGVELPDTYSEDVGNDWLDVMENAWGTITFDNGIWAEELTDNGSCTWGKDHTDANLDDGDATLLATHGGAFPTADPDYFLASLSNNYGNHGSSTCGSRGTNMTLGNDDAEFVHSTACHSCEWNLIVDHTDVMHYRLHQFGGFHGEYWSNGNSRIDDFAEEGFTSASSLRWAWIENETIWDIHGSDDNCALSMVQGISSSDTTARSNYEDYDPGQYSDPSGQTVIKFYYYCGCDPSGTNSVPLPCN